MMRGMVPAAAGGMAVLWQLSALDSCKGGLKPAGACSRATGAMPGTSVLTAPYCVLLRSVPQVGAAAMPDGFEHQRRL